MVIGIKYCGGCNPVYDRGRRVRSFMEDNPAHEYVTSDTGRVCDVWMVVCGCSRRCVDTKGLKAVRKLALLWDEESFGRLEQKIRDMAREVDGDFRERKCLCLREKAVGSRVMAKEEIQCFTGLTGDESGLHQDSPILARAGFDRPLVPGMFLDSLVSALMGTELPGSGALYMEHTARWIRPVFLGDTIEITVEFLSCEEQEDCYIGIFGGTCRNQKGERVLTARCSQMLKKSLFRVSGYTEERGQLDHDEFGTV